MATFTIIKTFKVNGESTRRVTIAAESFDEAERHANNMTICDGSEVHASLTYEPIGFNIKANNGTKTSLLCP